MATATGNGNGSGSGNCSTVSRVTGGKGGNFGTHEQQAEAEAEARFTCNSSGCKTEMAAAAAAVENLQNYHATRLKLQKFFIIHFVAAVESSRRVSEIFA